MLNRLLAIFSLDEHLTQQCHFLEEFLHRTIGDLVQHRFRLAGFAGFFNRYTAFRLDVGSIHSGSIDGLGFAGSDMHGKITTQRIVSACKIQQHADLAAMQIAGQLAAYSRVALETADADILTQFHDQRLASLFYTGGTVDDSHTRQCGYISRIVLRHGLGYIFCEGDKVFILGDEIGFAVHFRHCTGLAVVREIGADHTLGRHTTGRLARLGTALDTHLFLGRFQIAVGFYQRSFAFHHAETCHLAQFLNHTCCNF